MIETFFKTTGKLNTHLVYDLFKTFVRTRPVLKILLPNLQEAIDFIQKWELKLHQREKCESTNWIWKRTSVNDIFELCFEDQQITNSTSAILLTLVFKTCNNCCWNKEIVQITFNKNQWNLNTLFSNALFFL